MANKSRHEECQGNVVGSEIMTILEFLRSLSWEMNMYTVDIVWLLLNKCSQCKKIVYTIDDEYSLEGSALDEFRKESKENGEVFHHLDYPDVYNTLINKCTITISNNKIVIEHIEDDLENINFVCESCEDCEE